MVRPSITAEIYSWLSFSIQSSQCCTPNHGLAWIEKVFAKRYSRLKDSIVGYCFYIGQDGFLVENAYTLKKKLTSLTLDCRTPVLDQDFKVLGLIHLLVEYALDIVKEVKWETAWDGLLGFNGFMLTTNNSHSLLNSNQFH